MPGPTANFWSNAKSKINEVKVLLNTKTHISKITLRKAAILFQVLDLFYRRLMILSDRHLHGGPGR